MIEKASLLEKVKDPETAEDVFSSLCTFLSFLKLQRWVWGGCKTKGGVPWYFRERQALALLRWLLILSLSTKHTDQCIRPQGGIRCSNVRRGNFSLSRQMMLRAFVTGSILQTMWKSTTQSGHWRDKVFRELGMQIQERKFLLKHTDISGGMRTKRSKWQSRIPLACSAILIHTKYYFVHFTHTTEATVSTRDPAASQDRQLAADSTERNFFSSIDSFTVTLGREMVWELKGQFGTVGFRKWTLGQQTLLRKVSTHHTQVTSRSTLGKQEEKNRNWNHFKKEVRKLWFSEPLWKTHSAQPRENTGLV